MTRSNKLPTFKNVYLTIKLVIDDAADVGEVLKNLNYNFSSEIGSPQEDGKTYFEKYGEAISDTEIVCSSYVENIGINLR